MNRIRFNEKIVEKETLPENGSVGSEMLSPMWCTENITYLTLNKFKKRIFL